jgi:hypothetical protein
VKQLTDLALKLARKQKEVVEIVKEELTVWEEIYGKQTVGQKAMVGMVDKANEAHQKKIDLLKEELGLFTAGDINQGLEDMLFQYEQMVDAGIDKNQLADEFGDKLHSWLKLAKDNNIELPKGTREMADDLRGKVNPEIDKMITNWVVLRNNINATGKVINGITWSSGEKMGTSIGEGFRKGIKDGLDHGTVEFGKWVKRIEDTNIYIKPQLDLEGWNEAVQDAIAGRIPDTTG